MLAPLLSIREESSSLILERIDRITRLFRRYLGGFEKMPSSASSREKLLLKRNNNNEEEDDEEGERRVENRTFFRLRIRSSSFGHAEGVFCSFFFFFGDGDREEFDREV